jgi:hypothetical protein
MSIAYSKSEPLLELVEDVPQRVVVGVELNLARAIKDDVVLAQLLEPILQPLKVVLQLLECVQYAAVGTELVVAHDIFELDQAADVERTGIVCMVVGRVKVDDGARAPYGAEKLVHCMLVRCL